MKQESLQLILRQAIQHLSTTSFHFYHPHHHHIEGIIIIKTKQDSKPSKLVLKLFQVIQPVTDRCWATSVAKKLSVTSWRWKNNWTKQFTNLNNPLVVSSYAIIYDFHFCQSSAWCVKSRMSEMNVRNIFQQRLGKTFLKNTLLKNTNYTSIITNPMHDVSNEECTWIECQKCFPVKIVRGNHHFNVWLKQANDSLK